MTPALPTTLPRVLPAVGRALGGLAVGAVCYAAVRAPYQAAATFAASLALRVWDPDLSLVLLDGGQRVAGSIAQRTLTLERTDLDGLLAGAVLLTALFAARAPAHPVKTVLGAFVLLFAAQFLCVSLAALGASWAGESRMLSSAAGQVAAAGTWIAPLGLWIHCLRQVRPASRAVRTAASRAVRTAASGARS